MKNRAKESSKQMKIMDQIFFFKPFLSTNDSANRKADFKSKKIQCYNYYIMIQIDFIVFVCNNYYDNIYILYYVICFENTGFMRSISASVLIVLDRAACNQKQLCAVLYELDTV